MFSSLEDAFRSSSTAIRNTVIGFNTVQLKTHSLAFHSEGLLLPLKCHFSTRPGEHVHVFFLTCSCVCVVAHMYMYMLGWRLPSRNYHIQMVIQWKSPP